jgi:hypothetical protein
MEAIKQLGVDNCNWGLDNGEIFDGYMFRDGDGLSINGHPSN